MKNSELKKALIIGSGPIIIGQGAEFDYSGTQGCRALKEEGVEVVLLNSNPATIMTDFNIADKIYIEPMTVESCEEIIKKEMPQGLIATLGGQTALNLARDLWNKGILSKYKVKLLGTGIDAIEKAEDREHFKALMEKIEEPITESRIVTTVEEAVKFSSIIGYPVIIRPAYTLGGTGGGIAHNLKELQDIAYSGITSSPIGQILVEKSLLGYKEIEYEVIRDNIGTAITICAMENLDPVGVHTGDSIVVAPTQTLNDLQYHLLRTSALKIVNALKIEGGCNVQFALSPNDNSYYVIEVNPRVSRSSALASKVTGYPIAKVAAKIAMGYSLFEITNPITKNTACFEPTLDYVVVKIPKWPFDKFLEADNTLGTQMKATGEGMAMDTTFEGAFMKALSSMNMKLKDEDFSLENIYKSLQNPTSDRILWIIKALEEGVSVEKVVELTKITPWFIHKLKNITDIKMEIKNLGAILVNEGKLTLIEEMDSISAVESIISKGKVKSALKNTISNEGSTSALEKILSNKGNLALLKKAKAFGISDEELGQLTGTPWKSISEFRKNKKIVPVYKMVDTCAGEFFSDTPYYYSTYGEETEVEVTSNRKVIILGSGPIKIGQGIEFDYACVQCAVALRKIGIEAIMINNNPETVSTDFDISDKLYFEPITLENVLNIIDIEKPLGVITQFGGQTSLNLVKSLQDNNVKILGTSVKSLDIAEDRKSFEAFLQEIGIERPKGKTAGNLEEAEAAIEEIGYPALIRPSYVIGGEAMMIVRNYQQFQHYMKTALKIVSNEEPILIDEYIEGQEVEIDGIGTMTSKGYSLKIIGIMEHIERAGIHSGDSMTIFPPKNLTKKVIDKIIHHSKVISENLQISGMINIQYVIKDEKIYVIEVNPRASRTVPVFSKATGINVVEEATRVMVNKELGESNDFIEDGLAVSPNFTIVKGPVFSHFKLKNVNLVLGPQMKSTGEVMGVGKTLQEALAKTFTAVGTLNKKSFASNKVLVSIYDKKDVPSLGGLLQEKGYNLYASHGTGQALKEIDIPYLEIKEPTEYEALIKEGALAFVINTSIVSENKDSFGKKLRSLCVNYGVPCFTCIDTALVYLNTLEYLSKNSSLNYCDLREYKGEKVI